MSRSRAHGHFYRYYRLQHGDAVPADGYWPAGPFLARFCILEYPLGAVGSDHVRRSIFHRAGVGNPPDYRGQ